MNNQMSRKQRYGSGTSLQLEEYLIEPQVAGDEVSKVSSYLPEKGALCSSRSGVGEYQRNAPGPF